MSCSFCCVFESTSTATLYSAPYTSSPACPYTEAWHKTPVQWQVQGICGPLFSPVSDSSIIRPRIQKSRQTGMLPLPGTIPSPKKASDRRLPWSLFQEFYQKQDKSKHNRSSPPSKPHVIRRHSQHFRKEKCRRQVTIEVSRIHRESRTDSYAQAQTRGKIKQEE